MRRYTLLFLLLLLSVSSFAQRAARNIPDLSRNWKYKEGDDTTWARPSYNDNGWQEVKNPGTIDNRAFSGIGWFRKTFTLADSLVRPYALEISHNGASEIYYNGKKIGGFGNVSKDPSEEQAYHPQREIIVLDPDSSALHLIAIRYSNHLSRKHPFLFHEENRGFTLQIDDIERAATQNYEEAFITSTLFASLGFFFLTLSFVFFLLFLFYPLRVTNLYFALFVGAIGAINISGLILMNHTKPKFLQQTAVAAEIIFPFVFVALLGLVYTSFRQRLLKFFWVIVASFSFLLILAFLRIDSTIIFGLVAIAVLVECFRVTVLAIIRKAEGALIIGSGLLFFLVFFLGIFILGLIMGNISFNEEDGWLGMLLVVLLALAIISIPVSMTIYLARDFALTRKNLESKLVENQQLAEKTVAQEKEKQIILARQKEKLEEEVQLRTAELMEQKDKIQEQNREITDSIRYGERIQKAILPTEEYFKSLFPSSFILFLPKDIVSGDFFWCAEINGRKLLLVADCTGHGVPGALMSILGSTIINDVTHRISPPVAGPLLNELHKEINHSLKQKGDIGEQRDGMDGVLCVFEGNRLNVAAANNLLILVRDGKLVEIKGDKRAIGGWVENSSFTDQYFDLDQGDMIYLFSDGYADQFGGEKGKKFKLAALRDLFRKIAALPVSEQKQVLHDTMKHWRGGLDQVDDILVVGVRV